MTFKELAYEAQREILNLRPQQLSGNDQLTDLRIIINRVIDEWALDRFFVYAGQPGAYVVFVAFPDLTTDYTFAPGYTNLLVKWLAVKGFPSMKIYGKSDTPEMKQLEADAMAARHAMDGVGVV